MEGKIEEKEGGWKEGSTLKSSILETEFYMWFCFLCDGSQMYLHFVKSNNSLTALLY